MTTARQHESQQKAKGESEQSRLGPGTEKVTELLVQLQNHLIGDLRSHGGQLDFTDKDLESFVKVRAFLLGRRNDGMNTLVEKLEAALSAIAEANDEIDMFLEQLDDYRERALRARRFVAAR